MSDEELQRLHSRLLAVQSKIDQHGAAIRDIKERITVSATQSPPLSQKEMAELLKEVERHGEAIHVSGRIGVGIYRRLSRFGFVTLELNEWCRRTEQAE